MDNYELAVGEYLCGWGRAFIAPQFNVGYNPVTQVGGSAPDFVVLDYSKREVIVSEVSSGYNLDGLIKRIAERMCRWYIPIRHHLTTECRAIDAAWRFRTVAFIREEWTRDGDAWAEQQVDRSGTASDVTFIGLERVMLPYQWYDDRITRGIPNRGSATTVPDAPSR